MKQIKKIKKDLASKVIKKDTLKKVKGGSRDGIINPDVFVI